MNSKEIVMVFESACHLPITCIGGFTLCLFMLASASYVVFKFESQTVNLT